MSLLDQKIKLRRLVRERIAAGEFSVTGLARDLQIQQGSLSNFLRGANISDKLAARIQEVLKIEDWALLEPPPPWFSPGLNEVPLVTHATAMHVSVITPAIKKGTYIVDTGTLDSLPSYCTAARRSWARFVAIEVDEAQAKFMRPILREKATIVIDRHYQRIDFEYEQSRALYAVREGPRLWLAYVEAHHGHLTMRPHSHMLATYEILLKKNVQPSGLMVGRVCVRPPES